MTRPTGARVEHITANPFYGAQTSVIAKVLARSADLRTSEQQLMFAVLCQAITDLTDTLPLNNSRRFFETGRFMWFCQWVDLDPAYVLEVVNTALSIKSLALIGPVGRAA